MKKFPLLFLILICLSFNIFMATPLAATNVIKEGIYNISDLGFPLNNTYTIQNTSSNNSVYVFLFDKNQVVQQAFRLKPQSTKYNLIPLESDYKIVVVGNGEILIS